MNTTAVYPKMSQAQAMVGLYRSMSKKAKDEFRRWFFENEVKPIGEVPGSLSKDMDFLNEFTGAVHEAKEFKEGKTSFMSMEELMNEL